MSVEKVRLNDVELYCSSCLEPVALVLNFSGMNERVYLCATCAERVLEIIAFELIELGRTTNIRDLPKLSV